ncbi:hypothetical protein HYALB_00005262 [Hymenoscyphus albidus]|uniref:Uncharacterized protein n=1 Tax=Hymenoscyphus albidus TaxID=595503 RepID=A0A9N9PWU4_9HELO|nr:hypothetical protein HYALB_00005262 [Hymenoscyphus albidus]
MAPQRLIPSSNGIWTEESSEAFYKSFKPLRRRVGENNHHILTLPVDYRRDRRTTNTFKYTLSYEDELQLADHFAFLAAITENNSKGVSAAVHEEQREPPGIIIRLSANATPGPTVVEGLSDILSIVQALWKPAGATVNTENKRLHLRIYEQILNHKLLISTRRNKKGLAKLQKELISLASSLSALDDTPEKGQFNRLKGILREMYQVSNHGASNSLEKRLDTLGISGEICQGAEVRQIDKLSKYWLICLDLIRVSRQPTTRLLFKNSKLEKVEAPNSRRPAGSAVDCQVHCEVQLVLFYEFHEVDLTPRAIGCSKSACFLCDLFLGLHGKFGVSHSHMRFYQKWMIPEPEECDSRWGNPKQGKFFRGIVKSMTDELKRLEKRKVYPNPWAESKANVCVIVEEATPLTPPIGLERRSSSSSSSTIRASNQHGEDTRTEMNPPAEAKSQSRNSLIQKPINVANQIEEVKPEFDQRNTSPRILTPPQTCKPLSPSIPCQQHDGPSEPGLEEMNQSLSVSMGTAAAHDLSIGSNLDEKDGCYIDPRETTRPLISVTPAVKSPLHDNEIVERDEGEERSGSSSEEMVYSISTISSAQDSLTQPPILANEHVEEEANGNQNSESEEMDPPRATLTNQIQPIRESSLVTNQDKIPFPALNKIPPSQLWQQLNTAKQQQKHKKERHTASQPSTPPIEPSDHPTQNSSRNKMNVEIPKRLQNQNSRSPSLLHPFPKAEEIKPKEEEPKRKPSHQKSTHNSISPHQTTNQKILPRNPPQTSSQIFTHTSLPLSFPILPSTNTFTLLLTPLHEPNIEYLFDLTTISYGTIEISASKVKKTRRCVYVNQMGTEEEVFLRPDGDERVLEWGISFGRRDCMSLKVVITWSDGGEGVLG